MSYKPAAKIANSEVFHSFILFVILLNAIVMGLETNPILNDYYEGWFYYIYLVSQAIFAFEMVVRLLAFAPQFTAFFKDFWNIFDFVIVAASFIPAIGPFAIIARLARVLRVARIASVSDQLRDFLHKMHLSLGVLLRAFIVVCVAYYVFAIAGFYLFGEVDPAHWGGLGRSFRSLFLLTLLQNVESYLVNGLRGIYIYLSFFYLLMVALTINVTASVIVLHSRSSSAEVEHD